MKNILRYIACIMACLLVGGISGAVTVVQVTAWYPTLKKPFFNPPNYLFGPVWTVIYILMGVSFAMILRHRAAPYKKRAVWIFCLQLVSNFAWSIIFFVFHAIGLALVDIILLWSMIIAMIMVYYRIDRVAALLQLPYLCWVTFASLLNAAIFFLN